MTNRLLTATALSAALFTASAFAADLPSQKGPVYVPLPPPPLWTGFYVGVNLGGAWSANNVNGNNWGLYTDPVVGGQFLRPGFTNGSNAGGVVGGGQAGYNYQYGSSFVLGVETDIQGTSMNSRNNNWGNWGIWPSPVTAGVALLPLTANNGGVSLGWFGTLRGRAGYLVTPTLLLYGTGGFAYGGVEAGSRSNIRTGWTGGGGVEWMFLPHWSAKVEYLFVDLDSGGNTGSFGWTSGTNHHPQFNVVRAGVNYNFNWSAAPVVAKF
jgi:outer membrane immunogenic protein